MDRLSELLGHHVQFSYTAWDRIVLNGYLDRLQRPENIIHFFREVVGAPSVTPEVLMSRTAPYRGWVARYAEEQGIPFVPAPTACARKSSSPPLATACARKNSSPRTTCGSSSLRVWWRSSAARSRGGPSSRMSRAIRRPAAIPTIG